MELLTTFRAAAPHGLTYWEYYRGMRFLDAGDVCLLADDEVTRVPVGAVSVIPRMGGGALVLRPTEVALTAFDGLTNLETFVAPDLGASVFVAGDCDGDGTFFAVDSLGRLHIVEPQLPWTRVVLADLGQVRVVRWSADGDTAYLANQDGILAYPYDPITGFGAGLGVEVSAVDLLDSPEGLLVLTDTHLCRLSDGQVVTLAQIPIGRGTALASDGERTFVLSVDPDGLASLWRLPLPACPARSFGG